MDDRDGRSLHERVAALERAVTDGHADEGLPDAARMDARIEEVETTVGDIDDRLAELEAAVQALRGFAGGVRAVDEAVERRADAAIARVERFETELAAVRERIGGNRDGATPDATADDGPDRCEESLGRPSGASERSGTEPPTARGPDAGFDRGYDHDRDTLTDGVSTRSDAALADAAAAADGSEGTDGDRSLADRIRRLL